MKREFSRGSGGRQDAIPAAASPADVEHTATKLRVETFLASREAGRALTFDALKGGIRLQALVDAATDTARYADEALAIIQEEYRPHLHCQANCFYCCSKPGVLVSIPELLLILNYVRAHYEAEALTRLAARARNYAEQLGGRDPNHLIDESVPCPLLVDGRCSVYALRPLTCRGYNSTNVDACRRAATNAVVRVPIFLLLKDATDGTTVGAAQSLASLAFNSAMVDLGTALDIALRAGDTFVDGLIAGDKSLARAEHPTFVEQLSTLVSQAARRIGLEA